MAEISDILSAKFIITITAKKNLNPFASLSGPLELVLISGLGSVKLMRVIDCPWTGH